VQNTNMRSERGKKVLQTIDNPWLVQCSEINID
jgi:hypothetical protein